MRVNKATLARHLDLTVRRVDQKIVAGELPVSDAKGNFDLESCVVSYIRSLRSQIVPMRTDEKNAPPSLITERARLTKAKADVAEMQRQELMGLLIPTAQIEPAWLNLASVVRRRVLAIPSRAAARIGEIKDQASLSALLTEEIHEALDELSRTTVVNQGPFVLDEDGGEDAGVVPPAPEANRRRVGRPRRYLSPEASAEPGRWRTDRAPYQRGPMDAISDLEHAYCRHTQGNSDRLHRSCIERGRLLHRSGPEPAACDLADPGDGGSVEQGTPCADVARLARATGQGRRSDIADKRKPHPAKTLPRRHSDDHRRELRRRSCDAPDSRCPRRRGRQISRQRRVGRFAAEVGSSSTGNFLGS